MSTLQYIRYFPYGVDGMLAGSATVFFAYIGFDAVASTAEEVKSYASIHYHKNFLKPKGD